MNRWQPLSGHRLALIVAGCCFGLTVLALAWPTQPGVAAPAAGNVDYQLYQAIVERLQRGDNYYHAASVELRQPRGPQNLPYPTRSVFNWRLPTLAWLLACLPDWRWARWPFVLLSLVAVGLAARAARAHDPRRRAWLVPALLWTGLLWGWPGWPQEALLVHETWAGLLLALMVAAHAAAWHRLALCAGLAALFIRELALPGVGVMLYVALRRRHWAEATAWGIGIVGYAMVLMWHGSIVQRLMLPTDRVQELSWLQWGGWTFVLKTAHLHPLLLGFLGSQPWVVGMLLPLALGGFVLWRSPLGQVASLVTSTYVLAFCIVGLPFNFLWGLLYTPLWPLGLLGWLDWQPAAVGRGAATCPPSA